MSSSALSISIIDDDGFDWDAAVREIDVACIATSSTSSVPPPPGIIHESNPSNHGTSSGVGSVKESKSRQSTLDKYINRKCPRKPLEEIHADQCEFVGEDERVCNVKIDTEAAKTWIYPVNVPLRDYQFSIAKTALFSNTLVALPTGLGKTLIAAVVMYNYYRWFPEGKIVFAAPSRPLVLQQIEACHNVVGIPQEWTIDLTGQTTPLRRTAQWQEKRVFFLTPQILENDIHSGICTVKDIVCLVIDEAHRAMGNYAYCGAIRKLMDVPVQFRILALSATPGSKKQSIQQVIDNLHISTLEYRNESDKDVSPYVHNKDIELIEVPIGKDAAEANDLLSNVIHPFLARLCSLRVLHNRDVNAWGPPELLNWREKFRQAPPSDLSHANYGEVEGYFGILISLYHIRKLLSSHGIKPAYEMLEDKLRQGPFAKIIGRNEGIHQVKLIMQRSLSHGAPTPKLAKLLEVVTDHFNTKDPQSSRIIIFSNFRGSVRDIMSKLVTVGDNVKPTEFIGQSSGKTLKGQTQKIQQAVLKKFRDGGYNVIVATSIGEEGLDIMEVDLVICFDANVSPLRMVQRMGRTGRKHDGRVVVLACEGPEVKGYRKKLAFSNSMKKQLRNGGITNYTFHHSPRMVPHIFKPAVQYVELSIEQFVQRGKTVKDVPITQSPTPIDKLNDYEIQLLSKYFPTGGNCTMNLSLIAFPSCQLFPSRVHEVKHSFRSGMLIDSMQLLHGFSDNGNSRVISAEEEAFCGGECISKSNDESDFKSPNKYMEPQLSGHAHSSPSSHLQDNEFVGRHEDKENHFHCHPFQSEFISVDPLGKISIAPAPTLRQPNFANDLTMEGNKILDPELFEINQLPESPKPVKIISQKEDSNGDTPDIVAHGMSLLECHDKKIDLQDGQLSPRLTNFMLSGVVPESPECGMQNDEDRHNLPDCEYSTPIKPCRGTVLPSCLEKREVVCTENGNKKQNSASSGEGIHSPRVCTNRSGIPVVSPAVSEELNIPLIDFTSDNCSKDRLPNSGNKTETVERPRRLKRLRRHRDYLATNMEHKRIADADPSTPPFKYPAAGKTADEVKAFFDEEAEVSSGSDVSGDEEEDEENCNSYEDSFINDKTTSPSNATTQAEASSSTVDMIAIYRRSLLSQSPLVRKPEFFSDNDDFTPLKKTGTTGNGSMSSKMTYSNTERQIQHGINSTAQFDSVQLIPKGIVLSADPCTSDRFSAVSYHNGSRKRKLSSHEAEIIPPINLEKQFFSHSETSRPKSLPTVQSDADIFGDEAFFEGLDLDAIEAQATMLLQSKSKDQSQKQDTYDEPSTPTFDLGI